MENLYAHFDINTEEKQRLDHHLLEVARLASESAKIINQQNTLYLISILHDIGKADPLFQKKLLVNNNLRVNHSSAGAKYLYKYVNKNQKLFLNIDIIKDNKSIFMEFIEIIMYVVTSHHGLYDIYKYPDDVNILIKRLNYTEDKQYNYSKVENFFNIFLDLNEIDFNNILIISFKEYLNMKSLIKNDNKDSVVKNFNITMTVRLYLSFLKNADIEDTINSYKKVLNKPNEKLTSHKKEAYLKNIEDLYKKFDTPSTPINNIRNKIAIKALNRSLTDENGIYRLNIPTGAGKTLVSLRYGINRLVHKDNDRFIYITPFLSVLEQNAKEIKNTLKDQDILEHHSNIINENTDNLSKEQQNSNIYEQYLFDTWDSEVVLSTMVQFFNTIFGGKSNNIRRFSSLCNAVIVLDEIQSLPIEVTHIINLSLNYISKIMKTSIILCTATQPKLDDFSIKYPITYSPNKDIISLNDKELKTFERVQVRKMNNGILADEYRILDLCNDIQNDSILIILNTKSAVLKVYNLLIEKTNRKIFYLSTNMCAAHRAKTITIIKGLISEESIICVSTPLIEAGVDIDFKYVFRTLSGIDSIIQTMGRCNREGKFNNGYLEIIYPKKSLENINFKSLENMNTKTNTSRSILHQQNGLLDIPRFNNQFYSKYYNTDFNKMDYPLGTDYYSGLELLTRTRESSKYNLTQSFKEASLKIQLIKDETVTIIIHYEKSYSLINSLIEAIQEFEYSYDFNILVRIKNIIKKLQPYTISVYNVRELYPALIYRSDKSTFWGEIFILSEDYYDNQIGLTKLDDNVFLIF